MVRDTVEEFGFDFDDVLRVENDMALGNGGLGRLASCFLDCLASRELPGNGNGIRYDYGLFKQQFVDGYQVELPDAWLKSGNVWEVRRESESVNVHFGGNVYMKQMPDGSLKPVAENERILKAVLYDTGVVGYENDTVNTAVFGNMSAFTKITNYEASVGLSATVTFIGLYLGIIFLISSAAILALKELSDSSDNKERYKMLRKLGADEKMINKSLFRQVAIFFMFPLVVAIIHSIFGITFCSYVISTFGNEQLLPSIVMTAVFIVVIYGGYFVITYLCSKNIIKEN